MTVYDEIDEFLDAGGVPAARFDETGDSCEGTITAMKREQQTEFGDRSKLKYWDDGSPMMQLRVTLQTAERDPSIEDDNGLRNIFVRFNMRRAISDACRKANAKLRTGGHLAVTYSGNGTAQKGRQPPKLYSAVYTPPAEAETDAFLDTEEPQQEQPAQAAQPQQAADPAVAKLMASTGLSAEQAQAVLNLQNGDEPPF